MLTLRSFSLGIVGAVIPAVTLAGQGTDMACDRPRYSHTCALQAAGIAELERVRGGPDEREIRYWSTSGILFPEKLLILKQVRDSVSGRFLLLWPTTMMDDAFARSLCIQRWSNAAAGICSGRPFTPLDWSSIVRQLDAAGLSAVPESRVLEQYCDRTPIPPPPSEPDRLPVDRMCPMVFDGFTEVLEVRTEAGYWRYQFPRIPDSLATGRKRDQALLTILRGAARKRGDGPPQASGAP